MVKLTKIYTRTGDDGTSGLIGGLRAKKSSLRFAAIGDVDEANACIGLILSSLPDTSPVQTLLRRVQNDLFDLGADLATPQTSQNDLRIQADAVKALERHIDDLGKDLGPLTSFILPGGTEQAARFHMARTVVRRSERTIVALNDVERLNVDVLKYINRLSDLLFQLARVHNENGAYDVLWKPGGN